MTNTNILFVDLGYPREEFNEPLGIEVLANVLEHSNRDVNCKLVSLEINREPLDHIVKDFAPHIIAVSSKIGSLSLMNDLLLLVHKSRTGASTPFILIGDSLATFSSDLILREHPDAFCVIGEGERTLIDFVELFQLAGAHPETFRSRLIQRDIPNLSFIYNGEIVRTRRDHYDKLDDIVTPKRSFVEATLSQRGLIRIEASRGCAYSRCSFCVVKWKYDNSYWRPFSNSKIVTELNELSHYEIDKIFFTDEDFLGKDPKRLNDLLDSIEESKKERSINPTLKFFCSISVKTLIGKTGNSKGNEFLQLLPKMRKVGFSGFFIGIESGNDKQLSRYKKGVTAQDNFRMITKLVDLGFELDIGFIMFDPETNVTELEDNLNFIKYTGLTSHFSRLGKRLRLVPHTELCFRLSGRLGSFDFDNIEYNYDFLDGKIEMIYNYFNLFEQQRIEYCYALQGELRSSEQLDPARRMAIKERLGQLRKLDNQFLTECVRAANDDASHLEVTLKGLCDKFSQLGTGESVLN